MFVSTSTTTTLIALLVSASALGIDGSRSVTRRQLEAVDEDDALNSYAFVSPAAQGLAQFSAILSSQNHSTSSDDLPEAVLTTEVVTIASCAPTATNCPAGSKTTIVQPATSTPSDPNGMPISKVHLLGEAGLTLAASVERAMENDRDLASMGIKLEIGNGIASTASMEATTRELSVLFANLTYKSPLPLAPVIDVSPIIAILNGMVPTAADLAASAARLLGPAKEHINLPFNRSMALQNGIVADSIEYISTNASQVQNLTVAQLTNPYASFSPADRSFLVNQTLITLINITDLSMSLVEFFEGPNVPQTDQNLPGPSSAPAAAPVSSSLAAPSAAPNSTLTSPPTPTATAAPSENTSSTDLAQSLALALSEVVYWSSLLATLALELAGDRIELSEAFKPNVTGIGQIRGVVGGGLKAVKLRV